MLSESDEFPSRSEDGAEWRETGAITRATRWRPIGALISQGHAVAELASAIARWGVGVLDQFGRLTLTDEKAKDQALAALADFFSWQQREEPGAREAEDHRLVLLAYPGNQYLDSFWVTLDGYEGAQGVADLPAPIESHGKVRGGNPEKSATTRTEVTLLVLIAALAQALGISTQDRGAATRIRDLTEELGTPVDDDTIRNALKRIPDALERRRRD